MEYRKINTWSMFQRTLLSIFTKNRKLKQEINPPNLQQQQFDILNLGSQRIKFLFEFSLGWVSLPHYEQT
jgi:hypothetical protein